jgi:hypothetical protein
LSRVCSGSEYALFLMASSVAPDVACGAETDLELASRRVPPRVKDLRSFTRQRPARRTGGMLT